MLLTRTPGQSEIGGFISSRILFFYLRRFVNVEICLVDKSSSFCRSETSVDRRINKCGASREIRGGMRDRAQEPFPLWLLSPAVCTSTHVFWSSTGHPPILLYSPSCRDCPPLFSREGHPYANGAPVNLTDGTVDKDPGLTSLPQRHGMQRTAERDTRIRQVSP